MKTIRKNMALVLLLVICTIAAALPQMAMALTPACTTITNQATVNYNVQGLAQTPVSSNTSTFYVGVRENVTVVTTNVADVTVYPGSIQTALTFTVTNNGNTTMNFILNGIAEPNGTASPFGGNTASYTGTNMTLSQASISSLAPGFTNTVTLMVNTPVSETNGQVAVYGLSAQSQLLGGANITTKISNATGTAIGGATCTALGSTYIDIVSNSVGGSDYPANEGIDSARSAYQVSAANLTVTKVSVVYSDPVNGTTTPKAIPGATVTYTLTVSNASGTAIANGVAVTDSLATMITDGYLTFVTDYNDGTGAPVPCGAGSGLLITNGGGSETCFADGGATHSGVYADFGVTTANTITVTGLTVGPGQTATVKYQALIN